LKSTARPQGEESEIPALDRWFESDEDDALDWAADTRSEHDTVQKDEGDNVGSRNKLSLWARGVVDRYRLVFLRSSNPTQKSRTRPRVVIGSNSRHTAGSPNDPTLPSPSDSKPRGLNIRRSARQFLRTKSPSLFSPSPRPKRPASLSADNSSQASLSTLASTTNSGMVSGTGGMINTGPPSLRSEPSDLDEPASAASTNTRTSRIGRMLNIHGLSWRSEASDVDERASAASANSRNSRARRIFKIGSPSLQSEASDVDERVSTTSANSNKSSRIGKIFNIGGPSLRSEASDLSEPASATSENPRKPRRGWMLGIGRPSLRSKASDRSGKNWDELASAASAEDSLPSQMTSTGEIATGSGSKAIAVQAPSESGESETKDFLAAEGFASGTPGTLAAGSLEAELRPRPFVCTVEGCGKAYIRAEHLMRHVRSMHTNDKRESFCSGIQSDSN